MLTAEVQGASPSGWPDDARCYRIGLPTGHEEAEALSGASKSEQLLLLYLPKLTLWTHIYPLHAVQFDILFAHTATYPDEAPLLKISK